MSRIRLSLAQALLLVALVALVITIAMDYWRKRGTGVTSNDPVLALSPDGESLAMNVSFRPLFQYRHPVIVKDLGELISAPRMFESHRWIVSDVAWSSDGSTIITSSGDHTIRFWDARTGKEIQRIEDPSYTPSCLALSPDERFIAFGDHPLVHVWDVREAKTVASLKGLTKWVASVAFSPDGAYLAAASIGGKVQIWDTATWTLVKSTRDGPQFTRLVFTPDGRLVGGANRYEHARHQVIAATYDIPSLDIVEVFPVESSSNVRCVAVSRDGKLLAAAHGGADRELGHRAVTIWDLGSGKELARFEFENHSAMVDALEFSADGETLYGGSRNGRVTALSWKTGQSSVIFTRPSVPWKYALAGAFLWCVAWRFVPRLPKQS